MLCKHGSNRILSCRHIEEDGLRESDFQDTTSTLLAVLINHQSVLEFLIEFCTLNVIDENGQNVDICVNDEYGIREDYLNVY